MDVLLSCVGVWNNSVFLSVGDRFTSVRSVCVLVGAVGLQCDGGVLSV